MRQAVIMAAGKSTRTYPLTLTKPKPLLFIANKPILAYQLDQFVGLIDEVIIIVGFKQEMIREYFGDAYRGIQLKYVEQQEQLGTGHAAIQVRSHIHDRFLLLNGDDLYAREEIEGCLQYPYALLAKEVPDPEKWGILTVENGVVCDLVEKPEHPTSNLASVGLYVFDQKIFDILETIPKSPRGEYEVTDAVKQLAKVAEIHYHIVSKYWIPVGYPWSLLNANDFILENYFEEAESKGIIEKEVEIEGHLSLGERSIIRQGAIIHGNLCVGNNCIIGPECHITGNTSIGDNTYIGNCSAISNSVIEKQSWVGPFCNISYSILGEGAWIGTGTVTMSTLTESKTITSVIKGEPVDSGRTHLGVTLGSRVKIQPHVVTYPGVKIAPDTVIAPGTVVTEDIM